MKISTKGRYGLRIMIDLAINGKENPVSIKDIAERGNLSDKYLEQIINLLSKYGLVKSVRGARGGYLLTKEPDKITVEDILMATEGSLAPVACAENNDSCEKFCDCATSVIWAEIYTAVVGVVRNITLEDLVERTNGGACVNCNM
ncbi:MAG: Rrf2 family transcriptional regulator [Ruminococcaceae bacterium]|nr:Rrf2 family transcriptional regulator [Oscillospiraceae bacterium]MBQ6873250.1 Rrf2 family transcriptional regulator [Clostridia bacterium]